MQPGTKHKVGMLSFKIRGKREEIREQRCKTSYLPHSNRCQGLTLTTATSDGGNVYGLPIAGYGLRRVSFCGVSVRTTRLLAPPIMRALHPLGPPPLASPSQFCRADRGKVVWRENQKRRFSVNIQERQQQHPNR